MSDVGEPPATMAIEVAREHIRWCYRRGMTRQRIAESIGALGLCHADNRKGSLLVPVAAAWLTMAGGKLLAGFDGKDNTG